MKTEIFLNWKFYYFEYFENFEIFWKFWNFLKILKFYEIFEICFEILGNMLKFWKKCNRAALD